MAEQKPKLIDGLRKRYKEHDALKRQDVNKG